MVEILKRIKALVVVGETLGIEKMVSCIKPEEAQQMWLFISSRYFANMREKKQIEEMKHWEYQQEGVSIGFKYLHALKDACYKIANEQ